jgi:hypothetical protein
MKILGYTFALLLIPVLSIFSQAPLPPQTKVALSPILPTPAFKDGEELKYLIHYGFITGGEASINLKVEKFGGSMDVFHATAKGKTTGLAGKLFHVYDVYESFFDINSNFPLKSIRDITEGNYKYYNVVYFNHNNNTVESQKSGIHKVPENILDMVSAFFYVRRVDLSKFKGGEIIYVDTYFGDEVFPFYIIFKNREVISTEMGKFKCLRFVPIVEPGRIFKESDDMTFWLSDDDNKIPVRIKFDMIVGSFKCDLIDYKNTQYEMVSRIKKK